MKHKTFKTQHSTEITLYFYERKELKVMYRRFDSNTHSFIYSNRMDNRYYMQSIAHQGFYVLSEKWVFKNVRKLREFLKFNQKLSEKEIDDLYFYKDAETLFNHVSENSLASSTQFYLVMTIADESNPPSIYSLINPKKQQKDDRQKKRWNNIHVKHQYSTKYVK